MRHSPRSASSQGPSASARSMRSGARSCGRRVGRSSRWSIARRSSGGVAPWADAAERRRLDTTFSALKLEHRVRPEAVAADPDAGRRARAFVAYERAVTATGGLDFDDLVARALDLLETDPAVLAELARGLPRAPGRRGPGRRPVAARARPAARRARPPDLPGRRRRPVDLRLATRRCPARPGPGGSPAGTAPDGPRHELPLPGAGRRAGRPARRAQRGAVRQADRRPVPGATGRLVLAPDAVRR